MTNRLGSIPGEFQSESYWLRQKMNAAIMHLRDVEDFYRLLGGTNRSFNMIRADRARSIYEQITDDFLDGKTHIPTMKERAEGAEYALEYLEVDH